MSNLKNITDTILKDAQLEADKIIDNAKLEAKMVYDRKILEANKKAVILEKKGNEDLEKLEERLIAKANQNARDSVLSAKREILSRVFSGAKLKLKNLDEKQLLEIIQKVIDKNLDREKTVLVISNDFSYSNEELMKELNVCSVERQDLSSGFLLKNSGVVYNYEFDELVDYLEEDLESKVLSLLSNTK